eukprot:g3560.t1
MKSLSSSRNGAPSSKREAFTNGIKGLWGGGNKDKPRKTTGGAFNIREAQQKMRNLSEENEQLQLQVQQLKNVLRCQMEEAAKAKAEAAAFSDAGGDNVSSLSATNNVRLEKEVENLRKELKSVQGNASVAKAKAAKELRDALEKVEESRRKSIELTDMQDEINVLKASRASLEAALDKANAELKDLRDGAAAASAAALSMPLPPGGGLGSSAMTKNKGKSNELLKKAEEEEIRLKKEITKLREDLMSAADERGSLDNALAKAMSETSEYKESAVKMEVEMKEMKEKITMAQREIKTLKDVCSKAEKKAEDAKEALAIEEASCRAAGNRVAALSKSLDAARAETTAEKLAVEAAQKALNSLEQRRSAANLRAVEAESSLAEAEEEITRLKERVQDEIEGAKVKSKREVNMIKTLKSELSKLHAKHKRMESAYKTLAEQVPKMGNAVVAVPTKEKVFNDDGQPIAAAVEFTPVKRHTINDVNGNKSKEGSTPKLTSTGLRERAKAAAARLFSAEKGTTQNGSKNSPQPDSDGVKAALAKRLQQLLQQNAKVREEVKFLRENVQLLNGELDTKTKKINLLENKLKARGSLAHMTPTKSNEDDSGHNLSTPSNLFSSEQSSSSSSSSSSKIPVDNISVTSTNEVDIETVESKAILEDFLKSSDDEDEYEVGAQSNDGYDDDADELDDSINVMDV